MSSKSGQVMIEYAIIAAVLTLMVTVMALFLYVFRQEGSRVLDLVASEYP